MSYEKSLLSKDDVILEQPAYYDELLVDIPSKLPKPDLTPRIIFQGSAVEQNRWAIRDKLHLLSQYVLFDMRPKDAIDRELEEILDKAAQVGSTV